jgi:putative peptidoglycan lipid II flippase
MVRRAISNITNALVKQQTEIVSIAAMLMFVGLFTKFFGLLFNSLAAGFVGPEAYNTFLFASNIPELISQIILFGTISASVLPILSKVLADKGTKRFVKVFSTVINASLIIFTFMSVAIAATAHLFLPWFIETVLHPADPISQEEMRQIVNMMRVMMIPQVLLGLSIYLSTALNLYERFLVPQLAPLFYNLGRIAAIYVFTPFMGQSPWVLVMGTLMGAALHLLIQIPLINYVGIKYEPLMNLGDKYVRSIGVAAAPRVLSMSAEQISISIDKFIAFSLAGSSLAIYNLAVLVVAVPLSLFGGAFATASFPLLTKAFVNNDRIVASQMFVKIMNQILFLAIPAAVLLLILRVPVARLAFGIFGDGIGFLETYSIAWVILFFAPGIVFESLRTFLYRVFYAAHDTVRPLIVSVVVLILGAISGILLTNYLSHFSTFSITEITFNLSYFFEKKDGLSAVGGLALSSSIVFTLEALVLIYWLNRKYLHTPWSEIIAPITKKLLAGFVTALVTYLIYTIWGGLSTTERTVPLIILTMTTAASGFMIYIGSCGILKVSEVGVYLKFLSKYPNFNSIKKNVKNFLSFDPIPEQI